MSSNSDKSWMYKMNNNEGYICPSYCNKVDEFLDFAYSNEEFVERKLTQGGGIVFQIKCPCSKCKNTPYRKRDDVKLHLLSKGFMPNYTTWDQHGEMNNAFEHMEDDDDDDDGDDGCRRMVLENMYHNYTNQTFEFNEDGDAFETQEPNSSAKKFYDMLKDADMPLWDGCTQSASQLSATGPDPAYVDEVERLKAQVASLLEERKQEKEAAEAAAARMTAIEQMLAKFAPSTTAE